MLAYLFYLTSLRFIQPSVTSMLSSFEPLTATVLSFLFLQTVLGKWQIIGAGAILATLFLQLIPAKAKKIKK
nr:EamA family transporter [Bombilactobacillus mellifer]